MEDEHYDIQLTDLQCHSTKPTNPDSFLRKVEKSIRNNKPGRAYSSTITQKSDGKFEIAFDLTSPGGQEIQRAIQMGKKIRISVPAEGLPINLGPDMIEKLKAEKRKRKFRA